MFIELFRSNFGLGWSTANMTETAYSLGSKYKFIAITTFPITWLFE